MQVDTAQLRKAAARLRQDVTKQLERSVQPAGDAPVDGAFDLYTTAAPYTEAATAWSDEIRLLAAATRQLAEALESAADDYDRSDTDAARRMSPTR